MSRIFINIYRFLTKRRSLLWALLLGSLLLFVLLTARLDFQSGFMSFFPDKESNHHYERVFQSLKVKDNIMVMIAPKDSGRVEELTTEMVAVAARLEGELRRGEGAQYIDHVVGEVSGGVVRETSDFIQAHLPLFLSDEQWATMEGRLTPEAVDERMEQNLQTLLSPMGGAMQAHIIADPLGLSNEVMAQLQPFQSLANYQLREGYLFTPDGGTLLLVLAPTYSLVDTSHNEHLIRLLEQKVEEIETAHPELSVQFFGGPTVAVYNARQVQKDTAITISLAVLLIIAFVFVMYKSRWAILLLLVPVAYGFLFALGLFSLFQSSISMIALACGAVVMGVALSYSIHVLTHFNHVKSIEQLIDEIAQPLVIGNFTTVGAFLSLLFTSSDMLQDFGLFSALTLIGTTLFSLIFLPHLLGQPKHSATTERALRFVERISSYPFDKNRWLIGAIAVLGVVGLFLAPEVGFEEDMSSLNYQPEKVSQAEKRAAAFLPQKETEQISMVSFGQDEEEMLQNYRSHQEILGSFAAQGEVEQVISAEAFLVPPSEQQKRIERWQALWTPDAIAALRASLYTSAEKWGLEPTLFESFIQSLEQPIAPLSLAQVTDGLPFLENWVIEDEEGLMGLTQVELRPQQKGQVYTEVEEVAELIAFDRSYVTNTWSVAVHEDFSTVLGISSLIIFFALLISYGRIELTLMAFAPMAISWVINLGLMALLGIEFNVINIILSTFIFGLGDDYAIFMMDGMQQSYRTGKKLLMQHKTAILFSAVTSIIGMAVLLFAKHPAIHSISLVSIIGMVSVLLLAYTIVPLLFRRVILRPTRLGLPPFTLSNLLHTIYVYLLFVVGMLLLLLLLPTLLLYPKSQWRLRLNLLMSWCLRLLVPLCPFWKFEVLGEKHPEPHLIVANHQSMLDVLFIKAFIPRSVIVIKDWVARIPVLGLLLKAAGFIRMRVGIEEIQEVVAQRLSEGYDVLLFPEGSRSLDGRVGRFKKGAFLLSEQLQLPIQPMTLYGTIHALHKKLPLQIRPAHLVLSFLPPIYTKECDTPKSLAQEAKRLIVDEQARLIATYSHSGNRYFRYLLRSNYIYKGPVEEWYVKVKLQMERYYQPFEALIPRDAKVVDIGCGMGMLPMLLGQTAPERELLGIDYDEEKIALAQHSFARSENTSFVVADVTAYDLPTADLFILNDMLHYLPYDRQEQLLSHCVDRLSEGGLLIVRDSDAESREKQKVTWLSEFFSTRLLQFNKTQNELYFPSKSQFVDYADRHQLHLEVRANDSVTSNHIYIFRKHDSV